MNYQLLYCCYNASTVGDESILKEIQHLEIAKEKAIAIANATVKGKIWNSLGTKKALQEEIKVSLNNKIKINFIFLHPPYHLPVIEIIVFAKAVRFSSFFFFCGGYVFSFVVWDCSRKGFRSQALHHILLNYIQVMKAG